MKGVPRILLIAFLLPVGAGAAAILAHPEANPDVLEPSVENEVDHALACVPQLKIETNASVRAVQEEFLHLYATNGMNATAKAISLVSSQKNGEWQWHGTNVTPAAVWILRQLR